MILKCLIVDDEPIARNIIEGYVQKMPGIDCLGTCQNGIDALTFLKKNDIDLIFLDINMPELSGMDVAKTLSGNDSPAIVFTTAYPDYAVEGFEVEAIDYLVKPISFDRFYKAVQRVQAAMEKTIAPEKKSLFIKSDRKQHQVELTDILYLEAYGDYVKVHCTDKMLLTKDRLANLDKVLPDSLFVRIHRSYIVQFAAIEYIEGNLVKIKGQMIPVSQGYRKNLDI